MHEKFKFECWFEAQFGKRPSKTSELELLNNYMSAKRQVDDALDALLDCREWDRKRDAALKAWCAREKGDG
jgi:hypothetical protein